MMYQPYPVSIATRYLRTRNRSAFISFISAVSMLGITLGVGVLIIVMAVISGFETELERRILSITPHASLTGYAPPGVEVPIDNWPALRDAALERDGVTGAAPFVAGQGVLATDEAVLAVNVRGVDAELEPGVSSVSERIVDGDFASIADGWNIVVGHTLADELGLAIGDTAVLMLPDGRFSLAGASQRKRTFTVTGIFDIGMYEFDRGLVVIGFDRAATLFSTGGRAGGLGLAVDDVYEARTIGFDVAREIAAEFGGDFYVDDWSRRHVNIFRSIELTKPLLFIMLSAVIAVAAFNIVSTLFMVVRQKRGDIAILRTIGSAPRSILGIFIVQGTSIGVIGSLGGLLLGLVLVAYLGPIVGWIEATFGISLFAGDVYAIDDLPAEARVGEIARICLMALGLAMAATLYPAYRASRQPPAEALRRD